MLRCSKNAYAQCQYHHICGPIEEATFMEDSECAAFNQAVEDMPVTNAGSIRAMSDEELADFLCSFRENNGEGHLCNGCVAAEYCSPGHSGMIDWLQKPKEESK